MRISIKKELILDCFREECEECLGLRGQVLGDKLSNIDVKRLRCDLVDLLNKDVHFWNELNQTFRN